MLVLLLLFKINAISMRADISISVPRPGAWPRRRRCRGPLDGRTPLQTSRHVQTIPWHDVPGDSRPRDNSRDTSPRRRRRRGRHHTRRGRMHGEPRLARRAFGTIPLLPMLVQACHYLASLCLVLPFPVRRRSGTTAATAAATRNGSVAFFHMRAPVTLVGTDCSLPPSYWWTSGSGCGAQYRGGVGEGD